MSVEDNIIKDAIEYLDDERGNAGCNDYDVAASPESRALIEEYEAWAIGGCDLREWYAHPDYRPITAHNGKYTVNDGIWTYLLKKRLGLLDAVK